MTVPTALSVEASVEVPRFALASLREDTQHVLLWQARGRSECVVDGVPVALAGGTALWVPVRTEHRFTTSPNSALLPMFFDSRRVASPAAEPTVVTIDANAETLCLALIGSQYSLVQPSPDLEEMVLAVVAAHVVAPADTLMPRSLPALRMARSIVLNPSDPRTLTDWSGVLHVSTRTLERAFLAETGSTWQRWRHDHRMLRAAQLLSTTPLHVTEVGRRVGFSTPSAFTRAFRRHFGTTPSRHRLLRSNG